MGRLSLRVAECRGVTYGNVERSRRAISDARHESIAQHVQWHDEQERENRTAGVKLVKQGLSDPNGTIAFGRIRERFGKTGSSQTCFSSSGHPLTGRGPRNELWNNTCVYVLHKLGQCCVQLWISTCGGTRAVSPRQWKLVP